MPAGTGHACLGGSSGLILMLSFTEVLVSTNDLLSQSQPKFLVKTKVSRGSMMSCISVGEMIYVPGVDLKDTK